MVGWETIGQLREYIAVSLFIIPKTLDQLMEMDFLKGKISSEQVDRQLFYMERDKQVYYKPSDETYHTYKKYAKELNKKGYELF